MLTNQEKFAWLRLIRSRNVGPRTFWELLHIFGSASAALEMLPTMSKKSGGPANIVAPVSHIEREIANVEKFGASLVFATDPTYPQMLLSVEDRPPVLTIKGRLDLLSSNNMCIAIVGSRNTSTNGCIIATDLATSISNAGYTITSGLAKGIDAAAHKASIQNGTVGVIAGGVNHIYPYENKDLFMRMYESGSIISEQPFDSMPLAKHFPQRNRIISGMSVGIVVVEAAARSGTLITARYALEQGREVFAVPGSPLDIRCQGTNSLIKAGAHLVEDPNDVISVIKALRFDSNAPESLLERHTKTHNLLPSPSSCPTKELEKHREALLCGLSYSPTSLEDISTYNKIPAHILNYLVVELELAGKVERLLGNKIVMLHNNT